MEGQAKCQLHTEELQLWLWNSIYHKARGTAAWSISLYVQSCIWGRWRDGGRKQNSFLKSLRQFGKQLSWNLWKYDIEMDFMDDKTQSSPTTAWTKTAGDVIKNSWYVLMFVSGLRNLHIRGSRVILILAQMRPRLSRNMWPVIIFRYIWPHENEGVKGNDGVHDSLVSFV